MATLKILKEFENLLPKLTDDERNKLHKSLDEEGCREPVITWHNYIIDGHNRFNYCEERNIKYRIEKKDDLPDKEAVKLWIINNQLSRRNLTDEQRERFLGILLNTSKKTQGGARDNAGRKSKAQTEPLINDDDDDDNGELDTADTAEAIAKQHNVSRESIKRAGKYDTAVSRIAKVSPTAEAKIMNGEARNIVNKTDIRNLANASDAEIKKVAKAIEKDKTIKKTKEEETSVLQVYKLINEIKNSVNDLSEMITELAEGGRKTLPNKDRAEIASHIDKLSEQIQSIWQDIA